MKTLLKSVLFTCAIAAPLAQAANVSIVTNPSQTTVSYSKVFVDVRDAGSYLQAGGIYIYHAPKAKLPNGQFDEILINATNGTQYCRSLGHSARNTEGDGGSIACGEDESSYANYNFFSGRWESEGTGGSNQCYPLYKTIECK